MKTLKYLFIAALAIFSFNACEDVPVPYEIPTINGSGGTGGGSVSIPEGDGTLESPYNPAGVNDYISTLGADKNSDKAIYVKGIICSIKEAPNSQYGNATFYISADGKTTSEQFYVYRCYNLENKKFTDNDVLKVGDEVIIYGKVVNYKGNTPETVQSEAYIYSHSATTEEPEETVEMTVAEAIEAYSGTPTPAAVKGYIVGWVEGQNYESGARFNNNVTEENGYTDILLADTPDETDATKCIPVQLPSGNVRSKVNIKDNPGNYKKLVTLTGSIEKYFGVPGLKSVTKALFEGESEETPGEGGDDNTGTDAPEGSIAAIIAAGAGEATANGTVVATYARGFLMSDETGSILVYLGDDKGFAVGDAVTVSGTTSLYGGLLQFGNTSTATKNGTAAVETPTATQMTGADLDAYVANPTIKYVQYKGTLNVSGYYYNVNVDGASKAVGSIAYPKEGLVADELNGKEVIVTGYIVGVSGTKYVTTMATSVVAAESDDNTGEGDTTPEEGTIAAVIAAGAGEATANGTVVATYARGFLMSDETGSILVYLGSDNGYAVGDAVTVSGTTSLYAGLLQFGNTSTVTKNGTEIVNTPTATQMTGADLDAYVANPTVKYIQYKGTLNISGYYYNVNVEGASTAVGSIAYPKDGSVDASLNGKEVIVTGYAIGVSSSKFVNTMAVSVVAANPDDATGGDTPSENTIASIIAAGAGEATANGTVVATYARGFLMSDGTGNILVYLGSDNGYAVGDAVTVSGTTSLYAGLLQFGNTSTVTKNGTETVNTPTATQMTGADLDAYIANPTVKYVQYKGTLNISGYYYNVNVEGASKAVGSIAYPKDGSVDASLNGKEVIVTGYTIGVSSSKFVNTMAVSVVAANPDDTTGGEEEGGDEGGSEDESNVLTVAQLIEAYNNGTTTVGKVQGYIIGAVKSGTNYSPIFGITGVPDTNIIIADNPNETDASKCIPIQLPKGAVRTGVNLKDNPDNLGKKVILTGNIAAYFKVAGLRETSEYTIE
ncbi:MAG: hypothetical protein IJC92_05840 [Bacteroidaceae bacterium]|nr:hypothetical protein [Bacteroidaceae bacterium]